MGANCVRFLMLKIYRQNFNAICSELLWEKTHDIENAKKAVIDYQLELQAPTEEHELSYTQFALGISRICSKTKVDKFNFYKFLNNALSYIRDNYEKPGCCLKPNYKIKK